MTAADVPKTLDVQFIDPDGRVTGKKLVTVRPRNSAPPIDPVSWNQEQAFEELKAALSLRSDRSFEAVMSAFDRLGCWHEVLPWLRARYQTKITRWAIPCLHSGRATGSTLAGPWEA